MVCFAEVWRQGRISPTQVPYSFGIVFVLNFLKRCFHRPERRRNTGRRRSCLEALESRLLLAAVVDSGTSLTIQLEQDERLEISTDGNGTRFTSSNSVFTGIDLADELIFSGLGSNAASLNDLAFYDTVRIEAIGDGASIGFVDSGSSVYGHDLDLDFSDATISDVAVDFRGSSHLGDHDLTIVSSRRVLLRSGSELTTVDGDIDIQVRNTTDGTGHAGRGITFYDATMTTSGTGSIRLDGKGSDVVAEEGRKYGIDVRADSRIESTSTAVDAGTVSLVGQGGDGEASTHGVYIGYSTVNSQFGRINLEGHGGDGSMSFNTGITLYAATIQSFRAGNGDTALDLDGYGGAGTDSGHGILQYGGSLISTVDGQVTINGQGNGDNWASGVRIIDATIKSTGSGTVRVGGIAGTSSNVSHGVWIHGDSLVETNQAGIYLVGESHQDSGNSHMGVELADGATVRSGSGRISIEGTRTGDAVGSGHAVKFLKRDDADPVSVISQSGSIWIEALGNTGASRIYMDPETTVGGPEASGQMILTARDFIFKDHGTIQTTGRLDIRLPPDTDLRLGGDETDLTLSDAELSFFRDGFSLIAIGASGLSPIGSGHVEIDGAVFKAPVTIAGKDIVLSGGTALTAPAAALTGDVSIRTPHSTTVEGDLVLGRGSSLTLHGITGGTTLTVTGDFDIGSDVDLKIDWAPSPDDVPGVSHVLVDRSGGEGHFSGSSETEINQNFFGATVQYELSQDPRIKLNIPNTPLSTTVSKLGADDQHGVTTIFGAAAGDRFGQSVAAAGDINGDGVPDVLVGATHVDRDGANDAGAAYLVYGTADWSSDFSVDDVGQNVVMILGADVNDQTGRFVVADDLNGDGYNDLIIPANNADAAGNLKAQSGDVAIIWGAADLPNVIDLADLGDLGTIIYGADAGDLTGNPVEAIGDINGDGRMDLGIGAFRGDGPDNSGNDVGEVHILLGRATWPATIDLAADNDSHFVIYGEDDDDEFGVTIVGLGDVNADGEDDFSIAAWDADGMANDRERSGATYVFLGGDAWDSDVDLSTTSADLMIYGAAPFDLAGWESHGRGDVTGDGINDLLIATTLADSIHGPINTGGVVLIPGSAALGGVIDLANPPAEATVILGADIGDSTGRTAIVGDLNADGIDDLAVTARLADHPLDFGSNYGETYILLGRTNWPATIDLATPVDVDAVILGADNGDESGTMVRGIGDLNGDGQDEIAIGARYGDGFNNDLADAGEVAIVSGATLFDVTAPVATITTAYEAETSSSVLVFDVFFDEPMLTFGDQDLLMTDDLGTVTANLVLGKSSKISDTHYRMAVQRRTDQGSATLSIASDSVGTDVAGNQIDFGASSTATYRLTESAPVILRPTGVVSGHEFHLEWQPTWQATGYQHEIIRLGAESTVWASGRTSSLGFPIWGSSEDLPIGDYRAWVRAEFSDQTFGLWGSQAFTVSEAVSGIHIDSNVSVDRPTITFDEVTGATSYQIFASNFTSGASGYIDTVVSTNEWSASEDLPTGRYGFWVRAIGEDGFTANWSQSFVYDVYPELEPLNATIQQRPVLQWNEVTGAATYEIYVSGGGSVVNESGLTSTSFTLPNDAVVSNYRAWVRGVTSEGKQGPWSPLMKFSGGGRTQVSVAVETSGSAVPVFEWWAVDGAVDYEVYVARTGTAGAYYRQAGITENIFRSIPLPEGDYRVWVKSNFGEGNIAWSSGHSLTVAPTASFLTAPTDLSPDQPILNQRPPLSWAAINAASGYEILLRTGSTTELITGITSNQYTPVAAITTEDSQWWVRSIDNLGRAGAFSEAASFNTSGRPVLSVVPGSNPLFEWTPVLGAGRYILQADNLTTGQSSVIREDELTGTSYASPATLPSGNYRAWVRAVSSGDGSLSPWSILVDFTIDA